MLKPHSLPRLDGLDLARFISFVGMVIVNFTLAMGAPTNGGLLSLLVSALEGKAAATFVVLAGIGLGLSSQREDYSRTLKLTLKRSLFLFILGLLNMLIFNADILHYYAFFFLFGAFFITIRSRWILMAIILLNIAFVLMIFIFNFNAGWNWEKFSYSGFWTPIGFIRNLFFNGFHPIIPWMCFFLFGIVLSRLPLNDTKTQVKLILTGAIGYILVEVIAQAMTSYLLNISVELSTLTTTEPIPPMPLFLIAGFSVASFVIGICLRFSKALDTMGVLRVITPAGKQTLTLYIAHVIIGMGTLESLGMLNNQPLELACISALIFCLVATTYAYIWAKFFKRGPIESLMRRLTN